MIEDSSSSLDSGSPEASAWIKYGKKKDLELAAATPAPEPAAAAAAAVPAPAPAPATTAAAPALAPAALLVTNAITEAKKAIAQAGVVLGPATEPGHADDESGGEAVLDFRKKLSTVRVGVTAPFQFKAFSRSC